MLSVGKMGRILLSVMAMAVIVAIAIVIYLLVAISSSESVIENNELKNGARLEKTQCWFDPIENVECGWLHTAPVQPGGTSSFRLPVVVIRATGLSRKDDPLLYLAGGPGSSAMLDKTSFGSYWLPWYQDLNINRDLVLFDQRGSGLSQPRLDCPEVDAVSRHLLTNLGEPQENARQVQKALTECHQRLLEEKSPLHEFGTIFSATDAINLMDLLGYKLWNIEGVSYSTRLAMEIQRVSPEKIRSMVLDSVYPAEKHLFKEWPYLLKESLDRIFEYCKHATSCNEEYPDIEETFWGVMEALREEPLEFSVDEKQYGVGKVYVNDEILLSILFDSQYQPRGLYELPGVINAFANRDAEAVLGYVEDYLAYQFDDNFSEAVFWAVECADNIPLDEQDIANTYNGFAKLNYYLVPGYNACDIWNDSSLEKKKRGSLKLPESTNVPVLIFAGEDDPVTPVAWAVEMTSIYKSSYLFTFSGIAHSVLDSQPCSMDLFVSFLEEPGERPQADCRTDVVGGQNKTENPEDDETKTPDAPEDEEAQTGVPQT